MLHGLLIDLKRATGDAAEVQQPAAPRSPVIEDTVELKNPSLDNAQAFHREASLLLRLLADFSGGAEAHESGGTLHKPREERQDLFWRR